VCGCVCVCAHQWPSMQDGTVAMTSLHHKQTVVVEMFKLLHLAEIQRVPKLIITIIIVPPASNTPNSVCSSWISMKYRTLHYLNISYSQTHYDVRTLPCALSVTSIWRQSLLKLRYVQCIVIDKRIKQQHTCRRLRACIKAKGGHFEHKFRMIVSMTVLSFVKICQVLTILH